MGHSTHGDLRSTCRNGSSPTTMRLAKIELRLLLGWLQYLHLLRHLAMPPPLNRQGRWLTWKFAKLVMLSGQ